MTLAADAPTTDERENPTTATPGSIPPRTARPSIGATSNRSRDGLRQTVNHAEGHSTRPGRRGSWVKTEPGRSAVEGRAWRRTPHYGRLVAGCCGGLFPQLRRENQQPAITQRAVAVHPRSPKW